MRIIHSVYLTAVLAIVCINHRALANDITDFFDSGTRENASALNNDKEFLDVDDAFVLTLKPTPSGYLLEWTIAPNYYLYKRQFDLELAGGEKLTVQTRFSRGLQKKDGYFGLVEVYYHAATAMINKEAISNSSDKSSQSIKVKYQGCAEAGLCYPTQTRELSLAL